jgi:hypothetical protein
MGCCRERCFLYGKCFISNQVIARRHFGMSTNGDIKDDTAEFALIIRCKRTPGLVVMGPAPFWPT